MSIFRKTAIYFSLFPLISFANSQCFDTSNLMNRAIELKDNGQILMSSLHFSQIAATDCYQDKRNFALYHYSYNMIKLGEKMEAWRQLNLIESQEKKLNDSIKLLKNFYFDQNYKFESKILSEKFHLWKNKNDLKLLKQSQHIEFQNYANEKEKMNFKSPFIAGTLSLVPGLGQIYVGTYQSAAISFVINSMFLMAHNDFKENRQWGAANAAATVFSITYLGNILNSVRSANQINENQTRPLEQKLKLEAFGLDY